MCIRDRAGPVRHLLFWPPDLVRPDGGAQPDRGADGKNKIIANRAGASGSRAVGSRFLLQFTKSGSYVSEHAKFGRLTTENLGKTC